MLKLESYVKLWSYECNFQKIGGIWSSPCLVWALSTLKTCHPATFLDRLLYQICQLSIKHTIVN